MEFPARLTIVEEQLAIARVAMSEDEWGADRWVDAHERDLSNLKRIMDVHDGPTKSGTIVHLEHAVSAPRQGRESSTPEAR